MKGKIFILHAFGAPEHYIALEALARREGLTLVYRQLNFRDRIRDPWFLLTLPFRRPCKIVLGVAPYDNRLPWLLLLLRHHAVYYHTSYVCWDGSKFRHKAKNERVIAAWRKFTGSFARHIFAVSEATRRELVANGWATEDRISTVGHSYTFKVEPRPRVKDSSFVYAGRLVEFKGIRELLDIFSSRPEATLTIAGSGPLEGEVREYAAKNPNIIYKGYIRGFENMIPLYRQASFLVLNSKKTATWEELFGMTLFEGMACGCVPLASDHIGPREIITDGKDGILVPEGGISSAIDLAIAMTDTQYQPLRSAAISRGSSFHCSIVASRWSKVLE